LIILTPKKPWRKWMNTVNWYMFWLMINGIFIYIYSKWCLITIIIYQLYTINHQPNILMVFNYIWSPFYSK
jgi:hypothetical protein